MDLGWGGGRREERKKKVQVHRLKFVTATGGYFKNGPSYWETSIMGDIAKPPSSEISQDSHNIQDVRDFLEDIGNPASGEISQVAHNIEDVRDYLEDIGKPASGEMSQDAHNIEDAPVVTLVLWLEQDGVSGQ
jgi:hypothetical protein